MNPKLRHYVYIDKCGIESLYNQLSSANRTTKITTSNNLSGNIKSELDVGLKKILSGKLNSEIDSTNIISEEYVEEVTIEDKIESLIHSQAFEGDLQALINAIKETNNKLNGLIVCDSLFTFVKAYDEKNEKYVSQSDISQDPLKYKELSFYFNASHGLKKDNKNQNLLQINEDCFNVDMYLSGSNLVRRVRHLTHLIQYNKRFFLTVLGELTQCRNGYYYLKPFAIWDIVGF